MTGFDSVVLGPDDFLVLRPRDPDVSPALLQQWTQAIPSSLHGRVLIVDPTAFDVVHVHPLAAS